METHCFAAAEYGVLIVGYMVGMVALLGWLAVFFIAGNRPAQGFAGPRPIGGKTSAPPPPPPAFGVPYRDSRPRRKRKDGGRG